MKVFKNVMIYDYEKFYKNGYLVFDREIIEVGEMENYKEIKNAEEYDLKGKLLMPGFINSHMHIYSAFARGMIVPFNPKTFSDILKQLWWKLDAVLDEEAVYYSGLVSGVELLKNGVTTVIDHHASGEIIKGSLNTLKKAVTDEIGLRGIYCFETSDRFDVNSAIEENLEFMEKTSEKHAGMFGLHASLSLSDETLKKVGEVLDGKPIHIHVAESSEDEEDSMKKWGMRVIERLEKHGLLTKNSILAHCVHVNESEIDIMKKHEIFVAMNVTSNMNNSVGLPNYNKFKKAGIKVLIGNDGLGFNITRDYLNFFFSQKLVGGSPTSVGIEDLFNAIKNGYKLASELLNVKLGKIEKGYKADFVVLNYTPYTPVDETNVAGHIVFGVYDKPEITDVLIDGEFLVRNGELKVDYENIYKKAEQVAQKVWKKLK